MELKNELSEFLKKLDHAINLKGELIDLNIDNSKGRFTEEEFNELLEDLYSRCSGTPDETIALVAEEFHSKVLTFSHEELLM